MTKLKWTATLMVCLGATLTSLNIDTWNLIAFNLGSVLWCIIAYRMRETSLIAVNSFLIAIYIFGLIRGLL